jgi:hypothetical protein
MGMTNVAQGTPKRREPMTDWTADQLDHIGAAHEIEIAPYRSDRTLTSYTTIWDVRVDGGLYVRSWRGPTGHWFSTAKRTRQGRLRVGGVECDVAFHDAEVERNAIDAAYVAKYGSSGYVDAMVADTPAATTLRLYPANRSARSERP